MSSYTPQVGDKVMGDHTCGEFSVIVIGRVSRVGDDGKVWVDSAPPKGNTWGLDPRVYEITKVEIA